MPVKLETYSYSDGSTVKVAVDSDGAALQGEKWKKPVLPKGVREDHHRMGKVVALRAAVGHPVGILRSPTSGTVCFFAFQPNSRVSVWMGETLSSGYTMSVESFHRNYAGKIMMTPAEVDKGIEENIFV